MAPKRRTPPRIANKATPMNVFGPAPLIEGEDEDAYNDILQRISEAIQPKDVFEEIWVREMTDLSWELLRWRRLRVALFAGAAHEGVGAALTPWGLYGGGESVNEICRGYTSRDPTAHKKLEEKLASGSVPEIIQAMTLATRLSEIEQIERLIASSDARRNATLREIGRHRRDAADQLREASRRIDSEL